MKQRVISSALVLAITIIALYFNTPYFEITLAFIGLWGCYEYIKVRKEEFNYLLYVILVLTVAGIIIFHQYASMIMLAELILLMCVGIFDASEKYVDIAGVFMFSILFGYALYFLHYFENINKWMLGYIFVISYITDVFAFLVGKFFGKHKMNERVSPKKTIEGSIGGLIFGSICSFLWARYFNYFSYPEYLFIISSIILPMISEIGDLAFSLIKRYYGVKDYSNLIPGHGGILDRLDSNIFCIIVFGVLFTLLT